MQKSCQAQMIDDTALVCKSSSTFFSKVFLILARACSRICQELLNNSERATLRSSMRSIQLRYGGMCNARCATRRGAKFSQQKPARGARENSLTRAFLHRKIFFCSLNFL